MMGMGEGGGGFNDIMQQAVKIKGAMSASARTDFDARPTFIQNTMFSTTEIKEMREQDFDMRLESAKELKAQGTNFYKEQNYQEAEHTYEKALSVFRYLHNTDENWKNKGVKDETIKYIDFRGDNPDQKKEAEEFQTSCFLNIAQCQLKMKDYVLAGKACEEAIAIDPNNVKAHYRKAIALITPPSSGALEHDMAIKALTTAVAVNPTPAQRQNLSLSPSLSHLLTIFGGICSRVLFCSPFSVLPGRP